MWASSKTNYEHRLIYLIYITPTILLYFITIALQKEVSYKPLIFKNHKFKYEALCFNQIKLSEVIEDLCEFEIIFRVTPNVEVIA